jgi:hypothetical protein
VRLEQAHIRPTLGTGDRGSKTGKSAANNRHLDSAHDIASLSPTLTSCFVAHSETKGEVSGWNRMLGSS